MENLTTNSNPNLNPPPPTPTPTLQQQLQTPQPSAQVPPVTPSGTEQRYQKLQREGKKIEAIQAKINDTCPSKVLNDALEKIPTKGRVGSSPNFKLKEDNIKGKATNAALDVCIEEWKAGRYQSTTPSQQNTYIPTGPKLGEPLTNDDFLTLTANLNS